MKRTSWALPVIALALTLAPAPDAYATTRAWQHELTGRLLRIKETGVVRLGFRQGAIPFSYLGPDGTPAGYSLDLCRTIVATMARDLGRHLRVEYVQVTPQDRVDRVVSGAVDLECGATTNTAERRQRVAFSPVIFITGTRLAVPRASAFRSVGDLAGRRVAVIRGTTNEAAMRELERRRSLRLTLVVAETYADALAQLRSGDVDALAADDVLLHTHLLFTGRHRDFRIVDEHLSFEPYGILYPRDDPALAETVARTMGELARSREIAWIYERWFMRQLPSGERLELPMSTELRRALEMIGLPTD